MANETFNWDDVISDDGSESKVIILRGEYNFRVSEFNRGTFPGSEKLPACPQAELTLDIETEEGTAKCFVRLPLCKSMEWKLSGFFRAIGCKKHGEPVKMEWNKVAGAQGRADFQPRKYKKDGEDRETNDVKRWVDWDEKYFAPADLPVITGPGVEVPF